MSDFKIAGQNIRKGERKIVNLQVAKLYDFTEMSIPVEVIRGKKDGPTLFITAAIHGDEINGVEIIKRLLSSNAIKSLKGTLIAVPIVNVFGFNTKSRYLPDRRDLNRCFPGNKEGSLASQLANCLIEEVISKSNYGIDLHTAAIHRNNLVQIRAALDNEEIKTLAKSFGAPVVINSDIRDGSLRQAANEMNIPTLLFEGGEALRFNETVINSGKRGIISFMRQIGMLNNNKINNPGKMIKTFFADSSWWIRAPHSGTLTTKKKLGEFVKKDSILGVISDPFGQHKFEVKTKNEGIIIGMSMIPPVNEGDALFHIASLKKKSRTAEYKEFFEEVILDEAETYIT